MGDTALRRAMEQRQITVQALAERVGVDPKTVRRWMAGEGRTPYPRHRWKVCEVLEVDEVELWPAAVRQAVKTGPDREVLAVYPTIALVPREVWQQLIGGATRELALCFSAPHWLDREVPDLAGTLRRLAETGTRVRIVIADPDRPADGLPLSLAGRIEA